MRVRYSFAEQTPFSSSPGMCMNIGRPAPEPTKTALKPISSNSSSMESTLPMTMLVMTSTPIAFSFSTSLATMAFGRRNSGMP